MTKSVLLLDDDGAGKAVTTTTLGINRQYASKHQEQKKKKKKKEELSILEVKYPEKPATKGTLNKACKSEGGDKSSRGILFAGTTGGRNNDNKSGHRHGGEEDREDEDEDEDEEDSESDVVEDEDGELVTPAIEAQILKTLAEIRARSGKIYDPSVKFFSPEELTAAEAEWRAKREAKKARPLHLKDYHRERLLKGLVDSDQGEGDDADDDEQERAQALTHEEEQAELLRAFKSSAGLDAAEPDNGEEENETLLRVRPRTEEELAKEDDEYKEFLLENLATNENARESMSEWFALRDQSKGGRKGKGDQHMGAGPTGDEAFLIEYIMNRGWIDRERRALPTYDQIVGEAPEKEDLEEDERAVEEAEVFEERYNFRYEQPGGDQIATYGRRVEGSLRREDTKRKEQRVERRERKTAEALRKREELKRLKALKRQEIEDRLRKIQAISGAKELPKDIDLDSDFDPETHDRKMSALFNDAYYEQDEGRPPFGNDRGMGDDDADGVAESAGESHGLDTHIVEKAVKAVSKAAKRAAKKADGQHQLGEEEGNNDRDNNNNVSGANSPVAGGNKTNLSKYLDEYYQLDYEDMIGDLPCRFKYANVRPTTFGLKLGDIMRADDNTLNSYVSLRKLAPYRPPEVLASDEHKYASKKQLYKFHDLLRREGEAEGQMSDGRKRRRVVNKKERK